MVYRASALRGLAIAQMVLGCLMVVFEVAIIFAAPHSWMSLVRFGIWIGVWVIISGILGYAGTKDDLVPNKCLIGCFNGFCITACVLANIMFVCYCIALAEFADDLRCKTFYNYRDRSYSDCNYNSESLRAEAKKGVGLSSCHLFFAGVEFFVALASSIYCCSAVCCSSTGPQPYKKEEMPPPYSTENASMALVASDV